MIQAEPLAFCALLCSGCHRRVLVLRLCALRTPRHTGGCGDPSGQVVRGNLVCDCSIAPKVRPLVFEFPAGGSIVLRRE